MMRRCITFIALVCAVAAAPVLDAQAVAVRSPTNTLRFANAPLEDVIVAMGQMIGLTVVGRELQGGNHPLPGEALGQAGSYWLGGDQRSAR